MPIIYVDRACKSDVRFETGCPIRENGKKKYYLPTLLCSKVNTVSNHVFSILEPHTIAYFCPQDFDFFNSNGCGLFILLGR